MTPEEMEQAEALARENPRGEDESILHYVERLAVLAGLVRQEDTALLAGARPVPAKAQLEGGPLEPPPAALDPIPEGTRMPYKESDGEWWARMREEEARREQERVAGAKEGAGEPGAGDAPVITESDITDDDVPF